MHATGMDMVPAEYEGFEETRTAIVVRTPSLRHSADPTAEEMSRRLKDEMMSHISDLTLIRREEIVSWYDSHGWDNRDYQQLGNDLGADRVLIVDLDNVKLREGGTLYRGTCDATAEVIDVTSGGLVHTQSIDEFTYPKFAGQHVSETTEKRFRSLYLNVLASEIVRAYRKYDAHERFALDGKIASQ